MSGQSSGTLASRGWPCEGCLEGMSQLEVSLLCKQERHPLPFMPGRMSGPDIRYKHLYGHAKILQACLDLLQQECHTLFPGLTLIIYATAALQMQGTSLT